MASALLDDHLHQAVDGRRPCASCDGLSGSKPDRQSRADPARLRCHLGDRRIRLRHRLLQRAQPRLVLRASQSRRDRSSSTRRSSIVFGTSCHWPVMACWTSLCVAASTPSAIGGAHRLRASAGIASQALRISCSSLLTSSSISTRFSLVALQQAPAHVVVQLAEVRGDLSAGLHVEAVAQLADDRDGAIDQARLLGRVAALHAAARRGDALERAVHQHDDQAMRIRRRDATMRRSALVGSEVRCS